MVFPWFSYGLGYPRLQRLMCFEQVQLAPEAVLQRGIAVRLVQEVQQVQQLDSASSASRNGKVPGRAED